MKFLCVPCDEAMKLIDVEPPDRGSLSILYRCPKCDYEFAMLTNPYETQVVGSLGVQVGPAGSEAAKCPFPGVMQEMGVSLDGSSAELPWTADATERLANIPEFARPMAKSGIEKFAKEHGLTQIDVEALERARESFGM